MNDFATKFAKTNSEARSDVSPYRSSMLWTPDWEPHDEWLEALPFLFWLMDVLRPRDVVVVGEGVRDVFYAACQAAERFRVAARIRFFTQADESTAFIGAERIRRERWQGFSEVKRGGVEAVLPAADGIDLLCLSRSETARMDFETFSALRGRIRRTGGLLLEDPSAAEAVLEEPDQVFSFTLNLSSGPMVISPATTHAPRTVLQHVFAQFHDEPPLEFMFRGMLNKLGTGLRATASATIGWRTADRYEAELAHVGGALDLARNDVAALQGLAAEAERLRGEHEAELGRLVGALDQARTDFAALQVSAAEAARLRHEIARQRVEFAEREAENQQAVQRLRHACEAQADIARATQNALAQTRAELSAIVSSTSWRLTGPVRSALGRRRSSRRLARRSLKLLWWAATLQLYTRFKDWRHARSVVPLLAPAQGQAFAPTAAIISVAHTAEQPSMPEGFDESMHNRIDKIRAELNGLRSALTLETLRTDWALGAIEGMTADIDSYHTIRRQSDYLAAFEKAEPLVSVCVATVNRSALLMERAIRSLLAQTYQNLQIVVVGDYCTDDTAQRLAALRDGRVSFVNLPARGPYPRPGLDRWRVAGANAMNHALSLCEGDFVTHLDDDDSATADRIETLVAAAKERRADFLWHPFWYETHDGTWQRLGNGRFEVGQLTTGSIFYHRYFTRYPWDVHAYRLNEPGDWNRLRKIKILRPHLHFVDQPLLFHHKEQSQPVFVAYDGEQFLE